MTAMAGLVLLNGRVFTARAGEPPFTGGVAIVGDRIAAVGGDAAARAAAPPDARQIDVHGRSILPGFVDAHHHLAFTGAELAAVDVRYPGVASIADLIGHIAEAAERTPDGTWIRAVGMNPEMFREGRLPTRWDIDDATRVHPVLVQHMSGHHALANSLGLERRGLDDTAADPEGGHLIRDDRGRLTGYCLDAAQQLVVPAAVDIGHHGPGFHDDAPLQEIVADIDRGVRASLGAGITSIVDAQVTRRELNGYRVARERGLLGVRLTAMPISSQLDAFEALGLAGRFGDDRLAIGPMKFYADGALTGGTASFTTPYGAEGEFTGSLYWASEEDFRDAIVRAHAAGWQIGVHAQGDRAIDRVLDAYEAALRGHPRQDHRHRIEHCGGPRPDQLERIAQLGVMVVGQPRYFWDAGDAWLRVLDPERAHRLQPYREMIDAGVRFALSSDAPVASHRPMDTIASAVLRTTVSGDVIGSDQALSLDEAVRACTIDAAASYFADDHLGTLEVGKLADVVVLDAELFATPTTAIADVAVDMTVVGGEVAFRSERLMATADGIS
ncbi:MAG TPA: amidohydrolase [Candidatus Limnocylindrales bacterium]|nr:amidohydrolase [Candidatus Limnocylindrales bacterium]